MKEFLLNHADAIIIFLGGMASDYLAANPNSKWNGVWKALAAALSKKSPP